MSGEACEEQAARRDTRPTALRAALGSRSIVLIGMMGAGKSSVGRRLAARLRLPFVDADAEIEAAAGCTIAEMFERNGEPYFRAGERRVIARLLENGPQVLATGGGAWMCQTTRANVGASAVSVWLRAEVDILLRRVKRRGNRPLLAGQDAEKKLVQLVEERYPVYALADITVQSRDVTHQEVVEDILAALSDKLLEGPDGSIGEGG